MSGENGRCVKARSFGSERSLLLVAFFAGLTTSARANEPHPFVASFERFFAGEVGSTAGAPRQTSAGRLLLTELSCTACHLPPETLREELRPKRGPRLDGIGRRASTEWLRRFLIDPRSAQPGTTMPKPLARLSPERRRDKIESLVQFLLTQTEIFGPPFPESKESGLGSSSAQRGFRLYHDVGCVACHTIDESAKPRETTDELEVEIATERDRAPVASVPLGDLGAKHTMASLARFLLEPLRMRPHGRMPNLKLTPLEAADVAHYLLGGRTTRGASEPALDASRVEEGRQLFGALGCAQCHDLTGVTANLNSPGLTSLSTKSGLGCLTERGGFGFQYGLSARQHEALARTIEGELAPLEPSERLHQTMLSLNCFACHARNGPRGTEVGGVGPKRWAYFRTAGDIDLGDEGRIPPSLTGAGKKLRVEWLERVFAGTGDVRPHVLARMPRFGVDNVRGLARRFVEVDGGELSTAVELLEPEGDAEAGRTLLSAGCVQCHGVRGTRLPGVLGIDLTGIHERLQRRWFDEFVVDPAAKQPGTRMPTFFPDGKSTLPGILGGDLAKQTSALWAYLARSDTLPLPDVLRNARTMSFEIAPNDAPVVLRTFMSDAGTHAIAVGFPARVHFAFDAFEVRPAVAWRGRFLDAHGTRYDRFAPPAEPLGKDVVRFAPGPPFARLENATASWPDQHDIAFRGYRLDEERVPTFVYELAGLRIEDRIAPIPNEDQRGSEQGLRRRLSTAGDPRGAWFRPGVEATGGTEDRFVLRSGVTIRVGRPAVAHLVRGELRISIGRDARSTIELEYRW